MPVDLGREIGPLPLGAWIAVVAGGLGIAFYSRSQQTTVIDVPVESGNGVPGVGEGTGWIAVPPPTSAPPGAPEPATNDEWGRLAISRMIAIGYDPAAVDTAVRKYLGADALNAQEYAIIREALRLLGSPPIPLPAPPPAPVIPGPTPTPTPTPPPAPSPVPQGIRIHVVTPWNTRGSTLSGIAQIYYGDASRWPEIFNANRKGTRRPDGSPGFISNPHYLRPADRVYVP